MLRNSKLFWQHFGNFTVKHDQFPNSEEISGDFRRTPMWSFVKYLTNWGIFWTKLESPSWSSGLIIQCINPNFDKKINKKNETIRGYFRV